MPICQSNSIRLKIFVNKGKTAYRVAKTCQKWHFLPNLKLIFHNYTTAKKGDETKMHSNLKKRVVAIALILTSLMLASAMFVPSTGAHAPAWSIPTYAFINAAPNPIGVGQQINIIMWIDKIPDGAAVGNNIRWHNYNLTITKPDGSTVTTIFPTTQDTTSAQFTSYVPQTTGTYTFTFTFPQQQYTYTGLIYGFFGPPAPSVYTNDTYLSSTASTTVTVQQAQLQAITSFPLPTQYWTRPIYAENTNWWSISSNWLGTGSPQFTAENSYTNKYIPDAICPKPAT